MGFPKVDVDSLMSTVNKQNVFYDSVLDYLVQINKRLAAISLKLYHDYEMDPTPEELFEDWELNRKELL